MWCASNCGRTAWWRTPASGGRGTEIAELVFPDRILSYNPLVYTSRTESIYKTYLKSKAKKKDD